MINERTCACVTRLKYQCQGNKNVPFFDLTGHRPGVDKVPVVTRSRPKSSRQTLKKRQKIQMKTSRKILTNLGFTMSQRSGPPQRSAFGDGFIEANFPTVCAPTPGQLHQLCHGLHLCSKQEGNETVRKKTDMYTSLALNLLETLSSGCAFRLTCLTAVNSFPPGLDATHLCHRAFTPH